MSWLINKRKDSAEDLMRHGTKIKGQVVDINSISGGWEIVVKVRRDVSDYTYIKHVKVVPTKIRIGSSVVVYIDDRDADGEYFVKMM